MIRRLLALSAGLALLAGCQTPEPPSAPKGATATAPVGAKGASQGMSKDDLTVPGGSEGAYLPGSKVGGN